MTRVSWNRSLTCENIRTHAFTDKHTDILTDETSRGYVHTKNYKCSQNQYSGFCDKWPVPKRKTENLDIRAECTNFNIVWDAIPIVSTPATGIGKASTDIDESLQPWKSCNIGTIKLCPWKVGFSSNCHFPINIKYQSNLTESTFWENWEPLPRPKVTIWV